MTPEEKIELAELLTHRTRSYWEIRRERCVAAEVRLGMWENGKFAGNGIVELVGKGRDGKPLTQDEFTVLHGGALSSEEIDKICQEVETNTSKVFAKMVLEEKRAGRWHLGDGEAPSFIKGNIDPIIQAALDAKIFPQHRKIEYQREGGN